MNNIKIEWTDNNSILNQIFKSNKQKSSKNIKLDLRVYETTKYSTGLDELSIKVMASLGISNAFSESKTLISLLFILSINPFKINIMKGNGIDDIIDNFQKDEESGVIFIERKKMEKILNFNDLSLKSLDWFLENNLFELNDKKLVFKGNTIKSAKVYSGIYWLS